MTRKLKQLVLMLALPFIALSADAVDRKAADALYNQAILKDGNIDKALASLEATAADQSKSAKQRADAQLIRSDLLWRNGQRQPALDAVEKAIAIQPSVDAYMQKAQLLDASGDVEQAKTWYEKALPLTHDAGAATQVRLRLALMSASSGDPKLLVDLAKSQDQAFRNRAAVALAILGHQKEALDIFKVISTSNPDRFHEQLRVTEWAIRTGDAKRAQAQAWEAARSTTVIPDQRYALSLLVEAHRLDKSLPALIDQFSKEKNLLPEARPVWIDLLREAGRYDEAIALVKGKEEKTLTVDARHQLLRLYREAGRDEQVVVEYRKLIAAEPERIDWPRGLAEYYAGAGDTKAAEQVWRDFLTKHVKKPSLIQAGAEAAAQMGFDALAVEALEALIKREGAKTSASLSLFDLHRRAGRLMEARQVLTDLGQHLDARDDGRADLASAYERIELRADALAVWEGILRNGGELDHDEQMKVAKLYESLGRKQEALQAWQRVWGEQIPAAQRSIVEDRIMALAAELGRLDELATDLEIRHRAGKADYKDSSLLVRVYVKAQQKLLAVESIDEFFSKAGADPVQILKEQAKVYRLLNDGPAFERTTLELARIDPAGKPEYLRGLILDQLARDGPERVGKIRRLLAQLRESEGESADGEFEAGVLALAGFFDEAIDSYRRATVLNPRLADNYLLLGDALKKSQHSEEAVAQFQYLAATADSAPLLTAAVDGMLNTIIDNAYTPAGKQGREAFKWAQRTLLERLASQGEAVGFYQVFADVADAGGNPARSFSAVENSLPLADGLRSTTLRELITLATPADDDDFGSVRGQLKDAADNRVAYGRRLIALRESLPPEVYINAGKEFLARADTTSASRAFALAIDVTARSGLQGEIAQLYDKNGLDDDALEQYRLARVADSGDVEIMVRLARLLERTGERAQANDLYALALQTILMRQPPRVQLPPPQQVAPGAPAASDSAAVAMTTREYRTFWDITLQGLLITWPTDHDAASARLAQFEGLFDNELAAMRTAGEKSPRPLLRLDRMGGAVKYLALAVGEPEIVDRIDKKQSTSFEPVPGFLPLNASESEAWGHTPPQEDRGAKRSQFDAALEESARTSSFEYAANVALMNGDQGQMLAATRAWAKGLSPVAAVEWADHGRLNAGNFRSLCRYAAQLMREGGGFFYGFDRGAGTLERIEDVTGQPLTSGDALFKQLSSQIDSTGPQTGGFFLPEGSQGWIVQRLTPAQRMELLRRLGRADVNFYGLIGFWRAMLRSPLDAGMVDEGQQIVAAAMERSRSTRQSPSQILALLIDAQIDPANVEAYARLVRSWSERTPTRMDFYKPVVLLQSGQTAAALDAYLDVLRQAGRLMADGTKDDLVYPLDALRQVFLPEYQQDLKTRLDELQARDGLDRDLVQMRFRALYAQNFAAGEEAIGFLEKAVELSPGDEMLLAQLQGLYQMNSNVPRSIAALERLHRIDPAEPLYRAYLYASYLNTDRPVAAKQLNDSSPEDMSNPKFFESLGMRGNSGTGAAALTQPPPLSWQRDRYAPDFTSPKLKQAFIAHDPQAMQREIRRLWQRGTELNRDQGGMMPMDTSYQQVLAVAVPGTAPESGVAYPRTATQSFLKLQGQVSSDKPLFEAIASYPFAIGELEDYLRSTPAAWESQIPRLYGYLANAYRQQGLLEEKFATLDRAVKAGQATMREYTLWLTLLAERPAKPDPESLSVLDLRMSRLEKLPPQHLSLMARAYAAGGRMQRAAEVYRLKAVRYLRRSQDFQPDGFVELATGMPPNALGLLTESARCLDASTQTAFVKDIMKLVEPEPGADTAILQAYQLFLLSIDSSVAVGEPQASWPPTRLLMAAERQVTTGEVDAALRTIRLALMKRESEDRVVQSGQEAAAQAVSAYQTLLGVMPGLMIGLTPMEFAAKAPVSSLQKVAVALEQWRADPQVDPDLRVTLLAVMAYRLAEAGDRTAASAALDEVSVDMANPAAFNSETVGLTLDVANSLGGRLSLSAEQALLAAGRLETTHIAGIIERTAKEESIARAIELGEAAALYTQDDKLLAVMADLAKQAGKADRAEHWQEERLAAAQARQTLGVK